MKTYKIKTEGLTKNSNNYLLIEISESGVETKIDQSVNYSYISRQKKKLEHKEEKQKNENISR